MKTYKYEKIVTQGANGTTLMHKSSEEIVVFTLGEIDGYTYISCLDLGEQHKELNFIDVSLTQEEIKELHNQRYMKVSKESARKKIRQIKDFEDDLTDLKKVVQFMARGFAGLWVSLPQEIKDDNPYKENFDLFSTAVASTEFRLDLENDQVGKVAKILQDESEFAQIVKNEYLGKI